MGWMFVHKPENTGIKEFFQETLGFERDGERGEVLDCSVQNGSSAKNKVAYLAYKVESHEATRSRVFGLVCLIEQEQDIYYNFGYKDISEESLPFYYDCPKKILDLLTPTDNEGALEWRRLCYENIERKKLLRSLKAGDKIKFSSPIRFTDGREGDVFTLVERGKANLFVMDGDSHFYRIEDWRERNFEVLP